MNYIHSIGHGSAQQQISRETVTLTRLRIMQRRFLAMFAKTGNIAQACRITGVGRSTHYKWLRDEAYAVAFEEARTTAGEYLEGLARDLATGVYQRPIVSAGRVVAYQPIYDTRLLVTLLRANLPEKYGRQGRLAKTGVTVVKLVDSQVWDSI